MKSEHSRVVMGSIYDELV